MSLVVVSNRLPFTAVRGENGEWQVEPGSGGLVTALRPVLGNRGGRWIGWSGATEEELPDARALFEDSQHRFGYELLQRYCLANGILDCERFLPEHGASVL